MTDGPLDPLSRRLAHRTDRRGFLAVTARVTAFVAGTAFGFAGFGSRALACTPTDWVWRCCDFPTDPNCNANNWCPNCPNCPSGSTVYTWTCCDASGCQWACRDCNSGTGYCVCGWADGIGGCGGSNCLNRPPLRPANVPPPVRPSAHP